MCGNLLYEFQSQISSILNLKVNFTANYSGIPNLASVMEIYFWLPKLTIFRQVSREFVIGAYSVVFSV